MFVRFIRAKVADVDGLRAHLARGQGQMTAGDFVALARFDSADAAKANRARVEEGEWWRELLTFFDGEPEVKDTQRVSVLMAGSDDAGFVQIMEGTGDPDALAALDERFVEIAPTYRPDIMGGYRAYFDDSTWADVTYFTSEAEARAGESREMPPEVAKLFEEFGRVAGITAYHDLNDPRTV